MKIETIENATLDRTNVVTQRIPVEGGHIYRTIVKTTIQSLHQSESVSVHQVFVPHLNFEK